MTTSMNKSFQDLTECILSPWSEIVKANRNLSYSNGDLKHQIFDLKLLIISALPLRPRRRPGYPGFIFLRSSDICPRRAVARSLPWWYHNVFRPKCFLKSALHSAIIRAKGQTELSRSRHPTPQSQAIQVRLKPSHRSSSVPVL